MYIIRGHLGVAGLRAVDDRGLGDGRQHLSYSKTNTNMNKGGGGSSSSSSSSSTDNGTNNNNDDNNNNNIFSATKRPRPRIVIKQMMIVTIM